MIFANIVKIDSLTPLREHIEHLEPSSLVLFDVDRVIIVETDQIFLPQHTSAENLLHKELKTRDTDRLQSIIMLEAPVKLIDPKIYDIFSFLRQRNIPYMALTSTGTGPFGEINKIEIGE